MVWAIPTESAARDGSRALTRCCPESCRARRPKRKSAAGTIGDRLRPVTIEAMRSIPTLHPTCGGSSVRNGGSASGRRGRVNSLFGGRAPASLRLPPTARRVILRDMGGPLLEQTFVARATTYGGWFGLVGGVAVGFLSGTDLGWVVGGGVGFASGRIISRGTAVLYCSLLSNQSADQSADYDDAPRPAPPA
jgi:hypothetical protein